MVYTVAAVNCANSPQQTVYDPTCGSGSLLLKVADARLTIYVQEMDITTCGLDQMNMIMHGARMPRPLEVRPAVEFTPCLRVRSTFSAMRLRGPRRFPGR
nr:N-6 DNA methylase [Roseovarius sp. Pro17]